MANTHIHVKKSGDKRPHSSISSQSYTHVNSVLEQLHLQKIGLQRSLTLCPTLNHELHKRTMPYLQYCPVTSVQKETINGKPLNKIFASWWWTDSEVLVGTKSNSLCRLEVQHERITSIPSLTGNVTKQEVDDENNSSGIHCIVPSPNKKCFATGGDNVNSIAVYNLPDMEPECLFEGLHSDWVFDICWMDEGHLFSCGRDGQVALWKLPSESVNTSQDSANDRPYSLCSKPQASFQSSPDIKLRSMDRVMGMNQVLVTSMKKTLYSFDATRFADSWKTVHDFPSPEEGCSSTFVKAHPTKPFVYSVGHSTGFTICDARLPFCRAIRQDSANFSLNSVRSLDFFEDIFSYGTAMGSLFLMDIRNMHSIQYIKTVHQPVLPNLPGLNKGELNFSCLSAHLMGLSDSSFPRPVSGDDMDYLLRYYSALYTHSFSPDGYSVFCGGGPIPLSYQGCNACFWR